MAQGLTVIKCSVASIIRFISIAKLWNVSIEPKSSRFYKTSMWHAPQSLIEMQS